MPQSLVSDLLYFFYLLELILYFAVLLCIPGYILGLIHAPNLS